VPLRRCSPATRQGTLSPTCSVPLSIVGASTSIVISAPVGFPVEKPTGEKPHSLRSSPRGADAPARPLGGCRSAGLLILNLFVFVVSGSLKITLHWGCGSGAVANELDLMLIAAPGGVVAVSSSVDVAPAAFVAADCATRSCLCVSARREGGEEGEPYHPLLSTLLAMPLRGGAM